MEKKHIRRAIIFKRVGQTPLEALEEFRKTAQLGPVPLAYAGRLDPMAEGKLLVLIGDECKKQSQYHALDKAYRFEVLFNLESDTGDVLGLAQECTPTSTYTNKDIKKVCHDLTGKQTFPYPQFSSKTVQGKPLHTWAVEGKLDEINIPETTTTVYNLVHKSTRTISKNQLQKNIQEKIDTIPPITDPRKALGNDFRRADIRVRWEEVFAHTQQDTFRIDTFYCEASSGTYMRTLAETIGKKLGTCGLAYSIYRTKIGRILQTPFGIFWYKTF